MTGLEKILDAVSASGKESAERLFSSYLEKSDKLKLSIIKDAENDGKAMISNAEISAEELIKNAYSAAKLETKKRVLSLKDELIENAIKRAIEKISVLDDTEYFLYMYKSAVCRLKVGACLISFNERDKSRMPTDFIERLNSAKDGCSVKLSESAVNIAGGFILDFGDIYEDFSLDGLIEEKRDEIRQKAAEILFDKGDS